MAFISSGRYFYMLQDEEARAAYCVYRKLCPYIRIAQCIIQATIPTFLFSFKYLFYIRNADRAEDIAGDEKGKNCVCSHSRLVRFYLF